MIRFFDEFIINECHPLEPQKTGVAIVVGASDVPQTMSHLVQGNRDEVVQIIRGFAVKPMVPVDIFAKLDHHVWGRGVEIFSGKLIGQSHRVLAVFDNRA